MLDHVQEGQCIEFADAILQRLQRPLNDRETVRRPRGTNGGRVGFNADDLPAEDRAIEGGQPIGIGAVDDDGGDPVGHDRTVRRGK